MLGRIYFILPLLMSLLAFTPFDAYAAEKNPSKKEVAEHVSVFISTPQAAAQEHNKYDGDIIELKRQIADLKNDIAANNKSLFDSTLSSLEFFLAAVTVWLAITGFRGMRSWTQLKKDLHLELKQGLSSDIQDAIEKIYRSSYSSDVKNIRDEIEQLRQEILNIEADSKASQTNEEFFDK